MRIAQKSSGESARLKALSSLNILDTPQEEHFDRVTRMARRLFGVPIALVSLVDENRQWFKSRMGLDVTETPRDISFCGHAILGDDIFYIPDTLQDERFADNPLVLNEPRIRFYAGYPLRSLEGLKLGTLCIIDSKPRTLDAEDLETLRDLGSMIERELAALQLATIDELTSLTNRRGFMALAESSLQLCARQKMPASLVFIDLDKFKSINDQFGHKEGDRALVTFAYQMKKNSRDSDIVARLGGDEFVMLLANCSKFQSDITISRLREALSRGNRMGRFGYNISFSHGVVAYDVNKHPTLDCLLAEGDTVMYENKLGGDLTGCSLSAVNR